MNCGYLARTYPEVSKSRKSIGVSLVFSTLSVGIYILRLFVMDLRM
jgi:hypothetical protein